MGLAKAIKRKFGKKKSRGRRSAGLGTPEDALQDHLGTQATPPALADPLINAAPVPAPPLGDGYDTMGDGYDTMGDGYDTLGSPYAVSAGPEDAQREPAPGWSQASAPKNARAVPSLGSRRKYSDLKSKESHYDGEFEKATWRGGEVATGDRQGFNVKTHKASEEEFNDQYKVGVGTGGMLTGADGRFLDSDSATSGRGEEGLLTYAMNPDGKFGAADGFGKTRELNEGHDAWTHLPEDQRGERPDRDYFHHSSFFGEDDVAAAGEMKVKSGLLKQIDNNTGHFKTRDSQTIQALDELKGRGANIDHANVRMLQHDKVNPETGRPMDTLVPASAFMASGGNADAHWAKANMNAELLGISGQTQAHDDAMFLDDGSEGESELNDLMDATEDLDDDVRMSVVKKRIEEMGVVAEDIDLYFKEVDLYRDKNGGAVKSPERQQQDIQAERGVDKRTIAPRILSNINGSARNAGIAEIEQAKQPVPEVAYSAMPTSYDTIETHYAELDEPESDQRANVPSWMTPSAAPKATSAPSQAAPSAQAALGEDENYGFSDWLVNMLKADNDWPPTTDANGNAIGPASAPESTSSTEPEAAFDPNYGFADFIVDALKAEGEWPPANDADGNPI